MKTNINSWSAPKAERRAAFALASAVAIGVACSRTSDPVEHYMSASPVGTGTASGGKGSSSGGKPATSGGQAGKAPAVSGSEAVGGSDDMVAQGGQGGALDMPPEPPTDFGCGDAPVSNAAFSRRELRSAAAACAQWHYCRFEGGAQQLADELAMHAAAPSAETTAAVHQAYAQAFSLLSVNELFQFGPLASQAESAGKDGYQGKGLRELMYAWPLSARCRVEEQIALRTYTKSMSSVLVAGRGMFALDYLLYYPGNDTACSPNSSTGKAWPTLGDDGVTAGKLEYATALGDDILAQAQALRRAWATDGGNFTPVFVDASGYPSEPEAMKVLSWALLYVEREVKDWKLGLPAGHTATAPVSEAECAYSGLKTAAIRGNLRGFRGLFQGCGPNGEGLGFDDWLTEAGHAELAQDILTAYDAAQAAADDAPELKDASPEQLEALYQAVKHLADLLKNDLFGAGSPLGLALPKGIEGDTD